MIVNKLFSNLKWENWQNLILFSILIFLSLQLGFTFMEGSFPAEYGEDYLAFWGAGKIADEKNYSEIYDLDNLRSVQTRELNRLGYMVYLDDPSVPPIPAPLLPLFIAPFQFLSRIASDIGYWIWTILNFALLVGYLIFFLRKVQPEKKKLTSSKKIIILMILFFPVVNNLVEGQVNVLLMVCMGEFIRNAISKKPIPSGFWLAGLLLKPQLLVLIIPIIFLTRNWKVLYGFIISSMVILGSLLIMSGLAGTKELINLWVGWVNGISASMPNFMINWRMLGVNLNTLFNSAVGWVFTGVGISLSFLALCYLIKRCPPFGSPPWVLTMFGVFSATLAITWHAHYAMAMVLIPFMAFAYLHKLLPKNLIFFWVIFTPIVIFGTQVVSLAVLVLIKINIHAYQGQITAISGFILNLAILTSILHYSSMRSTNSQLEDADHLPLDLGVLPTDPVS